MLETIYKKKSLKQKELYNKVKITKSNNKSNNFIFQVLLTATRHKMNLRLQIVLKLRKGAHSHLKQPH